MAYRAVLVASSALAVATCSVFADAASVAGTRPHLALVAVRPVAVVATGFHAGERVRVEVRRAGPNARRTVRAGEHGRLRMTFATVRISRCDAISIVAVGSSGRRAALHRRPAPACGVP